MLLIRAPLVDGVRRQVLMVVNTGPGSDRAACILADGCALTSTEEEQLALFLGGRRLADIASLRERSLQTVRNQMQSIFEKTGRKGQSDLMRLGFSLSNLFSNLAPVLETASRANNRRVSFLRPNGRVVDATLAGARQGKLVICLPSIFGHPLTKSIEDGLSQAGIRMVCIARPGMGKTDPPPDGMSEADCVAEDVAAVVDQLQDDRFVLFGRASASALIFKICAPLHDRVSRAVVVNGVVPSAFVTHGNIAGYWARSLMAAATNSVSVARLILRSGRRLMQATGPQKFLMQMYGKSESDLVILADISVVQAMEQGARTITEQGLEAGSGDMVLALNDWSDAVARCPLRVTLMQGLEDPNVPIDASRALAAAFPAQCDLKEVSGGGLLNFSHPDLIIDELLNS